MSAIRESTSPFQLKAGDTLTGEFLYEFARESKLIRELVERARKQANPVPGWPDRVFMLPQIIRNELKGKTGLISLVEALMNCQQFPKTPALNLKDQNWLARLAGPGAIRPLPWVPAGVAGEQNAPEGSAVGAPRHDLARLVRVMTRTHDVAGYESPFCFAVDWRKPDSTILKELKSYILARRPDKFAKLRVIYSTQSAIFNRVRKLPFKITAAMDWLKTLQRFRSVSDSWNEFDKRWPRDRRQDEESWSRQRRHEKENALRIIEWLEQGAKRKLAREDFR